MHAYATLLISLASGEAQKSKLTKLTGGWLCTLCALLPRRITHRCGVLGDHVRHETRQIPLRNLASAPLRRVFIRHECVEGHGALVARGELEHGEPWRSGNADH